MSDNSRTVIAVYKPKGLTSYDVIRKLKKKYPGKKIGHGGTLDPNAEGVLVVGIGRNATKKLHTILKGTDKEYSATIELGRMSTTDDAEGKITRVKTDREPSESELKSALREFTGEIDQVPPRYSAVKVRGKPAYKRARAGEDFKLEARNVTIHRIELINYEYPLVKLVITCGSGVYIRSLARDLGAKLGTGGYLKELTRTRVGTYTSGDALSLSEIVRVKRV